MLNKYIIYFSKNNYDIDTIILLQSKLSRSLLYEQLCNMYNYTYMMIEKYNDEIYKQLFEMIDLNNLHISCNKNNIQIYK